MHAVPSRNSNASRKKLAQFREDYFYFERFATEVLKVKTFREAVELIQKRPLKHQPSDRYYVNLSILVYTSSIPEEAEWEERLLYVVLIRRWRVHSPDMFMPGVLDSLERSLSDPTEEPWIQTEEEKQKRDHIFQLARRAGIDPPRPYLRVAAPKHSKARAR